MFDELMQLAASWSERQPRAPRRYGPRDDHREFDDVAFRERHAEPVWTPALVKGLAPVAETLLEATRPASIVRNCP